MIGFDSTMVADGRSASGDTRERHVKYATALRRRHPDGEIEVVVRVPRSGSRRVIDVADGLRVHPVASARPAFVFGALRVAARLSGQRRVDVVTTQTPFDDGLVGVWLKRRFGLALNVQMHSSFLDMPWWIRERPGVYPSFNRLGKWVARRADTVRVVSYGEKARLERAFPHLRGKLVCLPVLVNRAVFEEPIHFDELEEARVLLRQRRLQAAPLLLFVGRLVPGKNIATLLRAFALANRAVPEAALAIAGDGPLRGDLERLAASLGAESRVVWLGALPLRSLRAWYASAVGVVLPSFYEGLPVVVMEAYLMGRPVLATPFVSARELVSEGTGFIAPDFHDVVWMAERMTFLLQHPEEARVMGQRGRTHVGAYLLSEEEHLDRLIGLWRDTLAMARRGG
jgi:glycosyltransferase involved in cell wall biosynthesis